MNLTDEEAEKMARAIAAAWPEVMNDCDPWSMIADATDPSERASQWSEIEGGRQQTLALARAAWLASPGPALRGEGGRDAPDLSGGTLSLHTHRRATEGPTYHIVSIEFEDHEEALAAYQWLGRATPEDASGMPKDFLPADVKAAVETVEIIARWFPSSNARDAINTLIKSHTALTEANERLRAGLDLAATRLLACAVNLGGKDYRASLDADDWSREARTLGEGS